ncbi:MAG: hypothetical protein IT342_20930 [Candidatus Melainabacteria bacterium]|nr:hypothetical protein [Candidatus Melainabacteria bacterium]
MSHKWERIVQQGEQLLKEMAFSEAAKQFEKALKEAERIGDADMRAESLQFLAMAHLECGSKAQADEESIRAAEIAKRRWGETSREYGQCLQFLADLLVDMNELSRAESIVSTSTGIIADSVLNHDCHSCRSALMGAYTLQLEILLRQGKFEQSRQCLRQMWVSSGSNGEFEEPQPDKLNEMLQEFNVKRTLGKSWHRLDRSSA